MSQIEKLVQKIRKRPVEADFADVERLLLHYGWELTRTKGSHNIFTKAGENPITVPKDGGKVKRTYLITVCNILGLDE